MKFNIIFRSCVRVENLSPLAKRPFNMTKEEITLKCLKSLAISCSSYKGAAKIKIYLVDDSSGDAVIKKMEDILNYFKLNYEVHRGNFKNNGLSLQYCYSLADKLDDIIYFCEDDYFHLEKAIPAIIDAYETKLIGNSNFSIFPADYPDSYEKIYPSYIFLSKFSHWRSVAGSTGTLVIPFKLFKKYRKYFDMFAEYNIKGRGGEEISLNKIWQEVPLLTPIPSLVTHLHEISLAPLIDWKAEIEKLKI